MMRRAGIALTAATVALAAAGPAHAAAPRGQVVTVMTFNIAAAVETGNDLDPIADVITSHRAQVVGLQEVDRSWSRSGSVDQARELALLTRSRYSFDPNLDCAARDFDDDGFCQYGTAILSRFPFQAGSARQFALPGPSWDEPRGLAEVRVVLGNRRLTVFNTHLSTHVSTRRPQVRAILARLAATPPPYILMGDLNARPNAIEIVWLRRRLTDTAGVLRLQRPTVGNTRIDYVFASRGIDVLSGTIPPRTDFPVSDHRPLVVRLRVR